MQSAQTINQLSKAQLERLAFIEFRLLFLGSINRPDLAQRFGLSESAASRDFALYKQLASENIRYDRSKAVYLPGEQVQPLFPHSPEQVLSTLSAGASDGFIYPSNAWLPSAFPVKTNAPNIGILIPLCRALYSGSALNVSYLSLSSGQTKRTLIPLSLIDNGLRWHIRAYEPSRDRYADFVINRIQSAELVDEVAHIEALRFADIQWQTELKLILTPHPRLEHPKTIAFEYDMSDDVLTVKVRAALAGYLLRSWNIDCTPNHSLCSPQYLLWLKNNEQIRLQLKENNISLAIAPGMDAQPNNLPIGTFAGGTSC